MSAERRFIISAGANTGYVMGEVPLWLAVVERAVRDWRSSHRTLRLGYSIRDDENCVVARKRIYKIRKWAYFDRNVGSLSWIADHIGTHLEMDERGFIDNVHNKLKILR